MLSTILLAAVAANGALAALIDVRQPWPYSGPLRVDPGTGERGIMTGVNRCTNSTQDSLCVNAVVNSVRQAMLGAILTGRSSTSASTPRPRRVRPRIRSA